MDIIYEVSDVISKIHDICSKNKIDFDINMDSDRCYIVMDELPTKKLTINIGNVNDEGLIDVLKEQLKDLEETFK